MPLIQRWDKNPFINIFNYCLPLHRSSNITICKIYLLVFVTDILYKLAQSVTCLATDASLTADPGVASLILARSYTFVEIDHEIISPPFC